MSVIEESLKSVAVKREAEPTENVDVPAESTNNTVIADKPVPATSDPQLSVSVRSKVVGSLAHRLLQAADHFVEEQHGDINGAEIGCAFAESYRLFVEDQMARFAAKRLGEELSKALKERSGTKPESGDSPSYHG